MHTGHRRPQSDGVDPLAELARLIGSDDTQSQIPKNRRATMESVIEADGPPERWPFEESADPAEQRATDQWFRAHARIGHDLLGSYVPCFRDAFYVRPWFLSFRTHYLLERIFH